MKYRHPLENPSLAPYGFVFPIRKMRLEYIPDHTKRWVNEEKIIARMWDRQNRTNSQHPLPVQVIIHQILPGLASVNRITTGDFVHEGLPYLSRDILVLSSTIQWFGTNVGKCFLDNDFEIESAKGYHPEREFCLKLRREERRRRLNMTSFFVHVCSERCTRSWFSTNHGCYYHNSDASRRDSAVIDGLMRWLGKKDGRTFIADFQEKKRRSWDAVRKKYPWDSGIILPDHQTVVV